MPYIKSGDGRREALRNGEPALTAGELNYQIFYYIKHNPIPSDRHKRKIEKFIKQFLGEKPNYQKYNDISGVIIRCDKELLRKIENYSLGYTLYFKLLLDAFDDEIAEYEDKKISENGDVE